MWSGAVKKPGSIICGAATARRRAVAWRAVSRHRGSGAVNLAAMRATATRSTSLARAPRRELEAATRGPRARRDARRTRGSRSVDVNAIDAAGLGPAWTSNWRDAAHASSSCAAQATFASMTVVRRD